MRRKITLVSHSGSSKRKILFYSSFSRILIKLPHFSENTFTFSLISVPPFQRILFQEHNSYFILPYLFFNNFDDINISILK